MEGFLKHHGENSHRLLRHQKVLQMCENSSTDDTADSRSNTTMRIMVNNEEVERKQWSVMYVVSDLGSELRCASEKCWRICLNSALRGSSDFRDMSLSKARLPNALAWSYTVKNVMS